MSDLDAIRERHVVYRNAMVQVDKVSGELAHEANEPWEDRDDWTWANLDVCDGCGQPWPCDAEQMRRERDEALALADRLAQSGERTITSSMDRQRILKRRLDAAREHADAAEAHAKALAEALRGVVDVRSTVLLRTTHPHCCQYVDEHGPDCKVGLALAAYDKDHER